MRSRAPRVALGALCVVVVIAGGWLTGASNEPPAATRRAGPAAVAGQPRGGTLVVALDADPGSLNPAVTSNPAVHAASELMFNGLVGWGADGEPVPELAERWTVEGGGTVYTFTLRDGVRWHDGRPLTADDVRFTFERALLPLHARTKASVGRAQPLLETPNSRTVVFRFQSPYAPLLRQLSVTEAPIIPRHVFEGCADLATTAGCPPNKSPVGTGAFRFASFTSSEIRVVRNTNYFRRGLPYLDEVVLRVIADPDRRSRALESGEVDWVWNLSGADAVRLRAESAATVVPTPRGPAGANCLLQTAFNLRPPEDRLPVFADQRVRLAFTHAVDPDSVVDRALPGEARVARGPFGVGVPPADEGGQTPGPDPDRARALLEEAGWKDEGRLARVARGVVGVPDGTELVLDLVHLPGQSDVGAALENNLRAVGVTVVSRPVGAAALNDNVFTRRTFDAALVTYCHGDDPEVGMRRQYATDQIGPAAETNAAGYSNPEVDGLFEQAVHQADPDQRRALYRRVQDVVSRDLPYWWLAQTDFLQAHRPSCTGFDHANPGLFAERASCAP